MAVMEEIPFITGRARLGSQVKVGYFDQHHRNVDKRNTVFQQIHGVNPLAVKQDVLGFLAKFQFRGDDVDKPVTALSGGERARLSLATLIREGVNLLLLDEPTNHMDIPSMEAVEDAILAFPGAVLLVTHDRFLLGRVADSLLRIHEGRAEWKEGGYEDNQAWVDLDLGQEDEAGDGVKDPKKAPKAEAKRPEAPQPTSVPAAEKPKAIDKDKQKAVKRLERHVAEAEAKVADLEGRMSEVQKALAAMDPSDWQAFNAKLNDQKALEEELAYAMSAWEEAQGALEEASR